MKKVKEAVTVGNVYQSTDSRRSLSRLTVTGLGVDHAEMTSDSGRRTITKLSRLQGSAYRLVEKAQETAKSGGFFR